MKTRRHHNNSGERQIRRGKTRKQVAAMARRLGVPTRSKAFKSCGHAWDSDCECYRIED